MKVKIEKVNAQKDDRAFRLESLKMRQLMRHDEALGFVKRERASQNSASATEFERHINNVSRAVAIYRIASTVRDLFTRKGVTRRERNFWDFMSSSNARLLIKQGFRLFEKG